MNLVILTIYPSIRKKIPFQQRNKFEAVLKRCLTHPSGSSGIPVPQPLRMTQPVPCDQHVFLYSFKSMMVLNGSCSLGLSGLSPSHTNQGPLSGPFTASLGAPLIYESFPKENTSPQQVLI